MVRSLFLNVSIRLSLRKQGTYSTVPLKRYLTISRMSGDVSVVGLWYSGLLRSSAISAANAGLVTLNNS